MLLLVLLLLVLLLLLLQCRLPNSGDTWIVAEGACGHHLKPIT
jgi:hypothetical protein